MEMKKIIYGALFGFLSLIWTANTIPVIAQNINVWTDVGGWGTIHQLGEGDKITWTGTDLNANKWSSLLDTIKKFINWMLWLLATIALAICIYAWFLMVTATGDDARYKKGMGILKQAAIGLVIIGLAWLIISAVFWLVGTMSTT